MVRLVPYFFLCQMKFLNKNRHTGYDGKKKLILSKIKPDIGFRVLKRLKYCKYGIFVN